MTNYLVQDSTGPQAAKLRKGTEPAHAQSTAKFTRTPVRRSLVPAEVRLNPGPGPHFISEFS